MASLLPRTERLDDVVRDALADPDWGAGNGGIDAALVGSARDLAAIAFAAGEADPASADGAFADRCPHRGTPLSQGTLVGTTLTCAAHTWEFDVRTGELLRLRAPACLSMRAVRERDGRIEVGSPS